MLVGWLSARVIEGVEFSTSTTGDNERKIRRSRSSKKDNADTKSLKLNNLSLSIFLTWLFYTCVFFYLSNLSLEEKLLYGVNARFWMQPNIIAFIWIGLGLSFILYFIKVKLGVFFWSLLILLTLVGLVGGQYHQWHDLMDQSDNK
jgi:hypothetical protein